MPRQRTIPLAFLVLALALAAGAHLATGDAVGGIHWPETWQFAQMRLRRTGIAGIVGASLGAAGVLLQALLRNPLASPDLIGVSSGASLGVAVASFLAYMSGAALLASPATQSVAALLGACAALGVVLAWTHRRGGIDIVSLVLVGIVVGMTCAGLTLVLHQLMPDRGFAASAWLLGAIDEDLPASVILAAVTALAACLALAVARSWAIDLATLGRDEARALGVRTARLRLELFLASGVLATVSVLLAGPIAFVGLIIPHAVRMLLGPHHGPLVLGAAAAGAAAVIGADAAVSAIPLHVSGRMPIGVVTAVIGGPLFLLLLRSMLKHASLGDD